MRGTVVRGTVVRAAHADVADRALDPRTLGLHPDDRYDLPGFRFARFSPERETAWVWGYSRAREEPLLVPESCVHVGPRPAADPGFSFESAHGSAMGGSPAEAALHALLQVAERDALLAAWYLRLPLPRVDLASAADPLVPMAAERIRDVLGYDVTAFVATLEQGLPVVWLMAVDAGEDPVRPRTACVAAADLDPERGLRRALDELGPVLESLIRRYDPAHAARLVADSDLVRLPSDHPVLHGHRGACGRLGFLAADGPALTVADLTAHLAWPVHGDPEADLAELAGRFLASGLDVITVDTTSPEAAAGGASSARVIVPGALPMTSGHRYRRTHGLPRLLALPRLLGHRREDLRPDRLNPFPHPFS